MEVERKQLGFEDDAGAGGEECARQRSVRCVRGAVSCRRTRVSRPRPDRVTMSLRKVRGNFERLFDKSLTDLVRGIRNNRDNEVSGTL